MTDFIAVKPASEIPGETRVGNTKYPFAAMSVGEAFLLPPGSHGAETSPHSLAPRVSNAASAYGKIHGKKFRCNRQPDGGVRVERVA